MSDIVKFSKIAMGVAIGVALSPEHLRMVEAHIKREQEIYSQKKTLEAIWRGSADDVEQQLSRIQSVEPRYSLGVVYGLVMAGAEFDGEGKIIRGPDSWFLRQLA